MRLQDKVALVTGASRGIGAAVCHAYAAEGAKVAVNFPPDPQMGAAAEQQAAQIRAAGGHAISVCADVSCRTHVEAMYKVIERELGPVDVVVANAARSMWTPWTSITDEDWDLVMAVNLRGALLCAQAAFPQMRARRTGRIITVSSVMVETGMTGALHYVTSKAGLVGFTRSLAREVGRYGICVNSVMPGAISTESEMERGLDQEELERDLCNRQAIPRRGLPRDLVGTFVFLASGESDFLTGQVITVDGGWTHH